MGGPAQRASWGRRLLEDEKLPWTLSSPTQDGCGKQRPAWGAASEPTTGRLFLGQRSGGWAPPSGLPSDTPLPADPPPAPTLTVDRESAKVLRPGSSASLTCVAPLSGVDFQLRRGAEEQLVPRASTSPDRVFFRLSALAAGDGSGYTCRYRLRSELAAWSRDSAPAELVLSDGEPAGRDRGAARTARARTEPGRGPARARGALAPASLRRGAQGRPRWALRPLWREPRGGCRTPKDSDQGRKAQERSSGARGCSFHKTRPHPVFLRLRTSAESVGMSASGEDRAGSGGRLRGGLSRLPGREQDGSFWGRIRFVRQPPARSPQGRSPRRSCRPNPRS